MRFSDVQIRIYEDDLRTGNIIEFMGKTYIIGNEVLQTMENHNTNLAIIGKGYCVQHELIFDGKSVGEAWFYSYRSFQGAQWAVMDEVLLYEEVSA